MMPEARLAPSVTEIEAVHIARELYGIDSIACALPGEYDDNFHLKTPDGRAFIFKVMHAARERSLIDLQCQALQHLAERTPHLALPRVCPVRSGEAFKPVTLADGSERIVWMLSFLPGIVLADVRPHTQELLQSLGRLLGEMDQALIGFSHPAAQRELKWDLARAGWIRDYLHCISDSSRRRIVGKFLDLYESAVVPVLPQLRRSVVYGDANDYNVLVRESCSQPRTVVSVIDFGDMHHGVTVSEIAIAAAYAILGKRDPVDAAASVIAGYHAALPLQESELAVLFPLLATRLAVSVVNSAQRKALIQDDPYVTISEAPAWEALERIADVHPRLAHYTFRAVCGLPAVPHGAAVARFLETNAGAAASILDAELRTQPSLVFDLGVGSSLLGADPRNAEAGNLTETIFAELKRAGIPVGVGRYDEPRLLYTSPLFGSSRNPTDERRTVHLGIDLFVEAGTPLRAPLDGVVHIVSNNRAPLDYGPLVILQHTTNDGQEFFTLYGHLAPNVLNTLRPGRGISYGEHFASVGAFHENGGWPPHLHFQIITDLLDLGADFPGVAPASERSVWTSLSPDPNLLLGIPADRFPAKAPDVTATLNARRAHLGRNLSVSYRRPLKIVRGWMQYLYDDTGRAYLDVYNNVPLVGHSHPRVVRSAQAQLALLNTNTRYLHDGINRYAARLTSLLPAPLRVCYFVNSGTEANELALRLARTHTRRKGIIVLEHAYHGHSSTLIEVSPYKFDGPGGAGRKPWVQVAPLPDDYRGVYRRGESELGAKYARHLKAILERAQEEGRPIAAFMAETLPSVAGQIVLPPGYLAAVYKHVRGAGGVCIADEVQVGFGRLGTHFWGFESQSVIPDILVLGKPIGNGFPMAALITTQEIAETFANGMEFFSTFGGNPVASAVGLAVLDVLKDERLQDNALSVGQYLMTKLRDLQDKYPLLGDVRGSGLFLGLDLVRDRANREPAPEEASYIVNRLRECGVLAGIDGPHHNVIKLRPPLMFSQLDADLLLSSLESVLSEDPAQSRGAKV